jgi:hypothetical protein
MYSTSLGARGSVVVEALIYNRKVAGSRSDEVDFFSFTLSFRPHYDPGVDSASNRNEYQES